jgi:hypothetical protein
MLEDLLAFVRLNSTCTGTCTGTESESSPFIIQMKNNNFINTSFSIKNCADINITFVPVKFDDIEQIENINFNQLVETDEFSPHVIYVEILQVEFFKQLFESLDKHFPEILIKFNSENDDDKSNFSIEINSVSNAGAISIESVYSGLNVFGKFKCLSAPIGINICLKNLNNVLETIEKNDILILSVEKNYKQNLIIQIVNPDKNYVKRKFKINLINSTFYYQEFKKIYSKQISVNSSEFFKICKDVGTIGELIQLQYLKKNVIFSCMESNKYSNYFKKKSEILLTKSFNNNDNIIGAYEVKDLLVFNKINDYIETLNIMLKDDGTIVLSIILKNEIIF